MYITYTNTECLCVSVSNTHVHTYIHTYIHHEMNKTYIQLKNLVHQHQYIDTCIHTISKPILSIHQEEASTLPCINLVQLGEHHYDSVLKL